MNLKFSRERLAKRYGFASWASLEKSNAGLVFVAIALSVMAISAFSYWSMK